MNTQNQSETMQAVWIARFGGPEGLEIRSLPKPRITADQVLVRVRASALNRADLLQRQGRYPAPAGYAQEIPGIEFAGEVGGRPTGADVEVRAEGLRVDRWWGTSPISDHAGASAGRGPRQSGL